MAAVLGISAHYHDAAAALVVDGKTVAALQQERITRVKHDPSVPIEAAAAVLSLGGLAPGDLDAVVYYENPYAKVERILVHALRNFPHSFRSLRRGLRAQLGTKLWVLDDLATRIGVPRAKVRSVHHHESHAAAALFTQSDSQAAVLTVDGVGEWATTTLWRGTPDGPQALEHIEFPHSLGLLYAAITAWLGFEVNGGEYKVMGLAAFGRPTRGPEIDAMLTLHSDGSFTLEPRFFAHFTDPDLAYGPALVAHLGPPRPPRPWDLDTPEDQAYADIAATLQHRIEGALLGLVHRLHRATSASTLCLAGGVALNAVANRTLQTQGPFETLWVQPAAGDAGGALGAALLGAVQEGDTPDRDFTPFLGQSSEPGKAFDVATHLGLRASRVADPAETLATHLAANRLVGVCTGRGEWGPRALGGRSLLANATSAATRDDLNARVKHREPFRPFAPAVRAEHCAEEFEGEADTLTRYMTSVRQVIHPDSLQAVTHVDGSARVQTVEDDGSLLRAVLERHPVVLNTSLNGGGEPICGTGIDALSFFLKHPIDVLVIDDIEVQRP